MKLGKIMVAVMAALAGMAGAAQATVTIDSSAIGYTFNMDYTGFVGGVTTTNVSAVGGFTYTGLSNNGLTYNFDYTLQNNSIFDSRLSSFALDANPNISDVSATGFFSYASQNVNYPAGFGNVEICFTAVSNGSCTGNGGGLTSNPDQLGSGSFALTFGQVMAAVDLSDFAVRFQAINPTVNGSSSGIGIGTLAGISEPVSAAPDPATWMLMIVGFGLTGMMLRTRARKDGLSSGERMKALSFAH